MGSPAGYPHQRQLSVADSGTGFREYRRGNPVLVRAVAGTGQRRHPRRELAARSAWFLQALPGSAHGVAGRLARDFGAHRSRRPSRPPVPQCGRPWRTLAGALFGAGRADAPVARLRGRRLPARRSRFGRACDLGGRLDTIPPTEGRIRLRVDFGGIRPEDANLYALYLDPVA